MAKKKMGKKENPVVHDFLSLPIMTCNLSHLLEMRLNELRLRADPTLDV